MTLENPSIFLESDQEAQQLAHRLLEYENKNVIVVAVSNAGWSIANLIAKQLKADFTFLPWEVIKDPADPQKSVGIVRFDYSSINESCRDIPQDYLIRQTQAIQADLALRYEDFYKTMEIKFQSRIVILVDYIASTSNEILACLNTIRNQSPEKIIVAVPTITASAAHDIAHEAEALIFIEIASEDSIRNILNNATGPMDGDSYSFS